ncbi:ATP-binding protein [Chloroflexota bacterium]
MTQLLGRAKGPGPDPHSFLFISPDKDQLLKVGEFITYQAVVDGQPQIVLARVVARQPVRLYPDGFSADPEIDPNRVAQIVGYSGTTSELFELTADVIGYYDETLHDFVNPRVPPQVGTPIFLADNDYLSAVLSRRRTGEVGAGEVGWLLSRPGGEVPIAIDIGAVVSTHLAVIASTGAGKSYTAGVLIEEMLKANNRAAILVVDPHGEYSTLDEIPNAKALQDSGYRPEARIYAPGDVKIRVGTLERGDLRYLLPNVTERMSYVLGRAYRSAEGMSRQRAGEADRWTLAELDEAIQQEGENEEDSFDRGSANALLWRLRSTIRTGQGNIFDDLMQTPLEDLFRPGRVSVMQLSQVGAREQQVIVAAMLRRIFQARLRTKNEQVFQGDDYYLPYPVFVLIEEAHNFAPAGADIVTTGILKQILAEGRKFGVGVGLISQRPGKLDADVLSQCNTQFLLRIVNPVDQARVRESVESVGRDLLAELPALTKGQAIISGAAVNTPVLCHIRQRHTEHGGADDYAPQMWIDYLEGGSTHRQQRDTALPAQRKKSNRWLKSD